MASSGSYTTNAIASSRSLTFSWWVNWQDIGSNTTQIGWQLVGSGGTSGSWVKGQNFRQWVNGAGYSSSENRSVYNGTVIMSGTTNIGHNADGGKSFSANTIAQMHQYTDNTTGSGSWALPTIPRSSTPTMSTTSFNIGDSPTIYTNRASSVFTHTIRVAFGSWSKTLATGVGTSWAWNTNTDASSLFSQIPNANSGTGTIYLDTYNGGTLIGTKTIGFTAKVTNSNPTFSDFNYKDTNTTTVDLTGNNQIIIKGYSNLQVTIPSANKMVSINGANAKNYNASIGDRNVSGDYSTNDVILNVGAINQASTSKLTVRAYDSRNNSTPVEKNITIYDYIAPSVNASITRLNNFENNTTLKVNGVYSPLNIGGVDKNTITTTGVQYRYCESGGTWGSWSNLTRTLDTATGKYTCNDVSLTLDNTKSWDFEIRCVDKLATTVLPTSVDIGIPPFFISSNLKAVGVNCIPPSNAPAGSIWYNNKQVLDYDVVDTW